MHDRSSGCIKPITGTWFLIYWLYHPAGDCRDLRYDHWDTATQRYTPDQWDAFMRDLASLGQKYLVLINTFGGEDGLTAVYDSAEAKRTAELGSGPDTLEIVFSAADRWGLRIFVTSDYYRSYDFSDVFDPACIRARRVIMKELAGRYARHSSFYGWYLSREAYISPYFPEEFIRYVNDTAADMRRLLPGGKILIAPYGTASAVCDEKFIGQLRRLDCDIIAYQDCIGCLSNTFEGSARAFAALRKAHDAAGRSALWADVETFAWDNGANILNSRLIPAPWERLKKQLEACSPYVDEILVFIFQGLLTDPDSPAYCGYEEAARLYRDYTGWLREAPPEILKR